MSQTELPPGAGPAVYDEKQAEREATGNGEDCGKVGTRVARPAGAATPQPSVGTTSTTNSDFKRGQWGQERTDRAC